MFFCAAREQPTCECRSDTCGGNSPSRWPTDGGTGTLIGGDRVTDGCRSVSGQRTAEYRWGLVGGAWLLAAALNAYIIVPASFLPVLTERLVIDATAASWLVSALFATSALAGVPVGIGLDRVDNGRAATVAGGVLVLACFWSWQAAQDGSYWSLIGARALAGLTFPVIWSACLTLIGRTFGPANRASAVGIFTTSAPAGFAVGQFAGPLIVGRLGWTAPFGVLAVPVAIATGAFWLASRRVGDPGEIDQVDRTDRTDGGERDDATDVESRSGPTVAELGAVLTDRGVLSVAVMGFLAYSAYVFFNSWMPTYLTQELDVSLATSGVLVAVFPAIGIVSRSASGLVSDRFLGRQRRPLVVVAFSASLPLVIVIAFTDVTALVAGCLLLAGLFIQLGIGILFTYVQELVSADVTATALSTLTTASSLGSFSGPVIAGALIESTQTYVAAFAYAAVVVGLGIVLARRGPESNPDR
jgi:nitrate/nitrite transporter NarK